MPQDKMALARQSESAPRAPRKKRKGLYRPVVCVAGITPQSTLANGSHSWEGLLEKEWESNEDGTKALSVDTFHRAPLGNYLRVLAPGIKIEIRLLNDPTDVFSDRSREVYWIATIIKICGYRLLVRFEGRDQEGDEQFDFWVNLGSDEVKHVGYRYDMGSHPLILAQANRAIRERHEDWSVYIFNRLHSCKTLTKNWAGERVTALTAGRFKIGDRLELLDRYESTRVRPARVIQQVGRRICVLVKEDVPPKYLSMEGDTQVNGGIWVDESSSLAFPVGWARRNKYGLQSTKEYEQHCDEIVEALQEGRTPPYLAIDSTPERFNDWKRNENSENLVSWEPGTKLECLDPLNLTFLEFRVATCLEVLQDGYLKIGFDGEEILEETLPIHSTSPLLFPCGYAAEYGIILRGPVDDDSFSWDTYLSENNARAANSALFNHLPTPERIGKFTVAFQFGSKIEAVDMCEPHLICPATIVDTKGRLLRLHFDGWEENMDQLVDYRSGDLFPIGWCEMYGYPLQPPKDEDGGSSQRKKKKK